MLELVKETLINASTCQYVLLLINFARVHVTLHHPLRAPNEGYTLCKVRPIYQSSSRAGNGIRKAVASIGWRFKFLASLLAHYRHPDSQLPRRQHVKMGILTSTTASLGRDMHADIHS